MPRAESMGTIWRRFRRGRDVRPLLCLAATAASGLLLAGLGLAGGWGWGMLRLDASPRPGFVGNVRDDDIVLGSVIAGVLWLPLLVWIWRPVVKLNRHSLSAGRRRAWVRPIAITVLIGGLTSVVSYVIERQRWDDTEYVVVGLTLIGGGVAALFWLPTVFALERGRPVVGPARRVDVRCPDCAYSMVGLRETVCPECGRAFTIDELVAAQDYEAHRREEGTDLFLSGGKE